MKQENPVPNTEIHVFVGDKLVARCLTRQLADQIFNDYWEQTKEVDNPNFGLSVSKKVFSSKNKKYLI